MNNSDLIDCPSILIQKSHVLSSIHKINDERNEPLSVPKFVTKEIICDIIIILEKAVFNNIIHRNIKYMIEVGTTLDFFGITDISHRLLLLIDERISIDNSFDVFKLTSKLPCFQVITMKSTMLIMREVQDYYISNGLSEYVVDPFVHMYSVMTMLEIESMISCHDQYYTVAKIMIITI